MIVPHVPQAGVQDFAFTVPSARGTLLSPCIMPGLFPHWLGPELPPDDLTPVCWLNVPVHYLNVEAPSRCEQFANLPMMGQA